MRRLAQARLIGATCLLSALIGSGHAAPDEDRLGRSQGYPVGTARSWFTDESVRVGSFTHLQLIPGILRGKSVELAPAEQPLTLEKSATEPPYRWSVRNQGGLDIDAYMQRQRVMALLIIKDGRLEVERYQYGRKPEHRFLSNSMAKSITALAIGIAVREGRIESLQDRADKYATALRGTLYGETTIQNLLRMGSGAKFEERYDGRDDLARFNGAADLRGLEAGAAVITERVAQQGRRFNYASAETYMLAAVLRAATGMGVSQYVESRLWKPMGAQDSAFWRTDQTGLEAAAGFFSATARDYARLGWLLANDGQRPDKPELGEIVPREFLLNATDWRRHDPAFQPRQANFYFGYGYQFWTFPTEPRRFALLGVFGQSIYVDPALKLVMVHLAADASPNPSQTTMGLERDALWRGLVAHYGRWDAGRFAR